MLATGAIQQTKFDLAAYDFGGIKAVRRDFGVETLSDVFAFPGAVKTINLWLEPDEPTDLVQAGFIPGGSYEVLDKDFKFIYRVARAENFGLSPVDTEFLEKAPHGSYYYVRFDSERGQSLALAWICKEPSPDLKRLIAEQWRDYHRSFIKPNINEIYLETSELTTENEIFWVSLGGNFNVDMTLATLLTQGEYHRFNPRYPLYIRPRTNMWFAFLQDDRPLRVSKILGEGTERVRERGGVFHLELQSRRTWQGVVRLTLTLQDALPLPPPPSPPVIPPPLEGSGTLVQSVRITASARNITHGAALLITDRLVINAAAINIAQASATCLMPPFNIEGESFNVANIDGSFLLTPFEVQAQATNVSVAEGALQPDQFVVEATGTVI